MQAMLSLSYLAYTSTNEFNHWSSLWERFNTFMDIAFRSLSHSVNLRLSKEGAQIRKVNLAMLRTL